MSKIKVYKSDGTFYEVKDPGVVRLEPTGEATLADRVATLEESNAEMTEALELILSGVTE